MYCSIDWRQAAYPNVAQCTQNLDLSIADASIGVCHGAQAAFWWVALHVSFSVRVKFLRMAAAPSPRAALPHAVLFLHNPNRLCLWLWQIAQGKAGFFWYRSSDWKLKCLLFQEIK
jgi:hypothetical protein